MKRRVKFTQAILFLIAASVLLLAGCASGPTIRSDYDRGADFSKYRTFAFFEPLGTDQSGYESLITLTLKNAVREQMESRGYRLVDSAPDLLVNFNGRLAQRTDVSQTPAPPPMYYGYRRGIYGGWGGYAYETRVDQYVEGTLNIDLIDAGRKQLVWEGVAVGRVGNKSREERQAVLRSAIAEIFADYPFRAGN